MVSGLYIFIGMLILVGTICQGTIGFGLGTIATPILALIAPDLVPTLVLLLAFVISTTTMLKARAAVSWDIVAISSLARIPGSMLGAWAIAAPTASRPATWTSVGGAHAPGSSADAAAS